MSPILAHLTLELSYFSSEWAHSNSTKRSRKRRRRRRRRRSRRGKRRRIGGRKGRERKKEQPNMVAIGNIEKKPQVMPM